VIPFFQKKKTKEEGREEREREEGLGPSVLIYGS
jgi:hypothetical protein